MRAIERKCCKDIQGRKVGSSTFQFSAGRSGKNEEGMRIHKETALVHLHFFSVSPLVVLVSSSLLLASSWSSWKDLVIPISSKCDISSRSCSPTLPFSTPSPATLSPFVLRHVTTMHSAVPATMVANRLLLITTLPMSHRRRERSSPLFLAPDIGPIRNFSLCA